MTHSEIIRSRSEQLEPLPTGVTSQLTTIEDIRAVMFDVYGTLFISASGDIGLASGTSRGAAIVEAMSAVGIAFRGNGDDALAMLHAEIRRQHDVSEAEYPEVEIRGVWRSLAVEFSDRQWVPHPVSEDQIERLAIEYEMLVNPVWPMPGLVECLGTVNRAGLAMGIVSNAQFFTRELFPALLGSTTDELGFASDLCIWSYAHLWAKPGVYLYQKAENALAGCGIAPTEVLYVGNDMRNDISPATRLGFRTVLFAGDSRSLRWREGDPLVEDVEPDAVVTDLRQILDILRLVPDQR